MESRAGIGANDLKTLAGIIRGPGFYATPSRKRVGRLLRNGLVKKKNGVLRPTLKGRIIIWLKGRR